MSHCAPTTRTLSLKFIPRINTLSQNLDEPREIRGVGCVPALLPHGIAVSCIKLLFYSADPMIGINRSSISLI